MARCISKMVFRVSVSGKSTPKEYLKPGHVAKEVIEDIAGWIEEQTG